MPQCLPYGRSPSCLPACRQARRQDYDLSAFVPYFVPLCLCAFVPFFTSCSKSPSKPDNGVTVSGTVTLEGRKDYSGATVKLFTPINLDTALTNLNKHYPTVGIELDQQTEFHWRQEQAKYETQTAADGSWKIQDVKAGNYHIVVEADSFGWQIKYNTSGTNNDFTLKKAITLSGTYTQNMNLPASSFVEITGNTTFETGTEFTIGGRSIVEFAGNYILVFKGTVNFNGIVSSQWTMVQGKQSNNHANIRIQNSDDAEFTYTNFYNIGSGVYFSNCQSVSMSYNRFSQSIYAAEFFNCAYIQVESNYLSNLNNGILTNSCSGLIERNIINSISEKGINSISDQNMSINYNVFKTCLNTGLGINLAMVSLASNVSIFFNDFINNYRHIDLGVGAFCLAHQNNFMTSEEYAVNADYSISIDTLDFRTNYWNATAFNLIEDRIKDYRDNPLPQYIGYIIDYRDFALAYIDNYILIPRQRAKI